MTDILALVIYGAWVSLPMSRSPGSLRSGGLRSNRWPGCVRRSTPWRASSLDLVGRYGKRRSCEYDSRAVKLNSLASPAAQGSGTLCRKMPRPRWQRVARLPCQDLIQQLLKTDVQACGSH